MCACKICLCFDIRTGEKLIYEFKKIYHVNADLFKLIQMFLAFMCGIYDLIEYWLRHLHHSAWPLLGYLTQSV